MARSILITDEIYYFYRLNRQGQRTSQNLESYFDMVEAVDGSVDEGLKHIVDNQQGAWLLHRLCRMALWGVELHSSRPAGQLCSAHRRRVRAGAAGVVAVPAAAPRER